MPYSSDKKETKESFEDSTSDMVITKSSRTVQCCIIIKNEDNMGLPRCHRMKPNFADIINEIIGIKTK